MTVKVRRPENLLHQGGGHDANASEASGRVKVRIPAALRAYAGGESIVEVPASTVGGAVGALVHRHEALRAHLYDEHGKLRAFVNLYLNAQDVRSLHKEDTPVRPGDVVLVLPSVAGGAR